MNSLQGEAKNVNKAAQVAAATYSNPNIDVAFFDSLEIGTYVDFYWRDRNRWEMAIVERFSEYRTEFEIAIGDQQGNIHGNYKSNVSYELI